MIQSKKKYTWIQILLIAVVAMSCSQTTYMELDKNEYIVFGHYYGNCLGDDCIQMYKLTNTELLEDKNKDYPSSEAPYHGNYVPMSTEKFDQVKGLVNSLPQEIFTEKNNPIGAPDAADGGGVYFEYMLDGERHFWLIDQVDANIPAYLRPFKNEINKSIKKLN